MNSTKSFDETLPNDAPYPRASRVPTSSTSLGIGRFILRLWSRFHPPPPALEPPGSGFVSEALPFEPEPMHEPQPVTTAESEREPKLDSGPKPEPEPEPEQIRAPRFVVRDLWLPKGGNTEVQWEDGYAVNASEGVMVVADGAGDGVFTKTWVDLLLDSFLACPLPARRPRRG